MKLLINYLAISGLLICAGARQGGPPPITSERAKQVAMDAINGMALTEPEHAAGPVGIDLNGSGTKYVVSYRGFEVWVDRADGRIRSINDKTVDRFKPREWPSDAIRRSGSHGLRRNT